METKWKVGDYALLQRHGEPPACLVQVYGIAENPVDEQDKYFFVRAITALLDWSADGIIARMPGEPWNAHYGELKKLPAAENPTGPLDSSISERAKWGEEADRDALIEELEAYNARNT